MFPDVSHRVVMIASGSRGNSLLVAGAQSRILIDMGLGQRRMAASLRAEGLEPDDLDAVFVTHTHGDHVGDATVKFCWRNKVPLVAPEENLSILRRRFRAASGRLDRAGLMRKLPRKGHHIDGLDIRPFRVPHDAEGVSLGYHLTLGNGNGAEPLRIAVATDLGEAPPEVVGALAAANVLILESNHDDTMLAASGRPVYLIDRIAGVEGHLSNDQAADTLEEILACQEPGHLRHVVLAHLSQECNTPELARTAADRVLSPLGDRAPSLLCASQDDPLRIL
jgi:phosphoribosyl 1,2-cyclic phosphodiesterase